MKNSTPNKAYMTITEAEKSQITKGIFSAIEFTSNMEANALFSFFDTIRNDATFDGIYKLVTSVEKVEVLFIILRDALTDAKNILGNDDLDLDYEKGLKVDINRMEQALDVIVDKTTLTFKFEK